MISQQSASDGITTREEPSSGPQKVDFQKVFLMKHHHNFSARQWVMDVHSSARSQSQPWYENWFLILATPVFFIFCFPSHHPISWYSNCLSQLMNLYIKFSIFRFLCGSGPDDIWHILIKYRLPICKANLQKRVENISKIQIKISHQH